MDGHTAIPQLGKAVPIRDKCTGGTLPNDEAQRISDFVNGCHPLCGHSCDGDEKGSGQGPSEAWHTIKRVIVLHGMTADLWPRFDLADGGSCLASGVPFTGEDLLHSSGTWHFTKPDLRGGRLLT